MKELYLIRGLPGSGKTTFAKKIAEVIYEADMFFLNDKGEYSYNSEKIGQAHTWCMDKAKEAMQKGIGPIAVANTFVKRWEMSAYKQWANMFGYTVTEITMNGQFQNIHNVPDSTIQRMKSTWE